CSSAPRGSADRLHRRRASAGPGRGSRDRAIPRHGGGAPSRRRTRSRSRIPPRRAATRSFRRGSARRRRRGRSSTRRDGGAARERHAEREDRAAGRVLDPQIATLPLDDAARCVEAYARAWEVLVCRTSRVGLEDPRAIAGRHAGSLVLHAHDRAIVAAFDTHRDPRPLGRVLRRVVHEPGDDLGGPPPIAAYEHRLSRPRTLELVATRHRSDLFQCGGDGCAEVESRAPEVELGTIGAYAGEDAIDEVIETLDLRGRLADRDRRLSVLLGELVEVAADHRKRRPQVVGHHRDELAARALELAQVLGRLALEEIERGLVDRERRLIRERADKAHLLLEELLVVGNLEHDRAEEPVVRDERYGDVIECDDRPPLADRALRGLHRAATELSRPRA